MGRNTASTSFVTPIKSDGVAQVQSATEFGRGAFTLLAGTTYFFPLGGQDTPRLSAHIQWDAAIAITAGKLEDSNFPEGTSAVEWFDDDAGEWIDEDPTTAFVGVVSAGTTVTNGVVAHTAGAKGGAMFHIDTGARRTRLRIDVGATGGEVRVSVWGKE